uniref:Uncharacterized protein n=1 Tax=Anguilla anguilla TaxID=7936 RepID=A0A0E9RUL6_ANGAN
MEVICVLLLFILVIVCFCNFLLTLFLLLCFYFLFLVQVLVCHDDVIAHISDWGGVFPGLQSTVLFC